MKEAGLHSISQYVKVQRQYVINYIINQPIFDACLEGARKRGFSLHQFWWDQPLSLNNYPPVGVDNNADECAEP
jgi:hypothetical protein